MTTSERTRIVVVTRATPLEHLLARCGTRGQVEFYLRTRGQEFAPYQDAHDRFTASLESVQAALPTHLRRVRVEREELDRFLFSPDDVVLVVGQDGLVANVAKYVDGQPVIGVNPDPERFDGILCRHTSVDVRELLLAYLGGSVRLEFEKRAMALAEREDGQRLYALNEIFVGHRSHQSARYEISARGGREHQSSSGVVVSTGTGSTGWARSIARQRGVVALPRPSEPRLAWFVREPFPSVSTGAELENGVISSGEQLWIRSEIGEGGVIFADGIESDWIEFLDGHAARIRVAKRKLHLVVGHTAAEPAVEASNTTEFDWIQDAT